MTTVLKKTIVFSIACHVLLFLAFSVSFGKKLTMMRYTSVSFLGQLLNKEEVVAPALPRNGFSTIKTQFSNFRYQKILENNSFFKEYLLDATKKPNFPFIADTQKSTASAFFFKEGADKKRKEQVIMFYPHLPYHFLLYFKDRQTAHIELSFHPASVERPHSLILKRKISSGNLEADLLSMRYIGHYLFVQQRGVLPQHWQTVKIELSSHSEK